MAFPYTGTKAFAGIACDGRGAYFGFTSAPNMHGDTARDGYSTIRLRVRFDDEPPLRSEFSQTWGSDQLSTASDTVRNGLLGKHKMMLEVPWYGEGNVIFEFDLTGSRKAYESACPGRAEQDRKRAARAREAAERRRAEESARQQSFQDLMDDPAKTKALIEAAGYICPEVASMDGTYSAYWFLKVFCHYQPKRRGERMVYQIKHGSREVAAGPRY